MVVIYKTLTVAYEGFIFDYTIDTGSDVQVYHDNAGQKDFIESIEVKQELKTVEDLHQFAVKWYHQRVDVELIKHIFMEDGDLTITVGTDLKFKQRVIEVDENYYETMIEVSHVAPNGKLTWIDQIYVDEVITYPNHHEMSYLVDDWMMTKRAVEKYQQLKQEVKRQKGA